MLVLLLVAPYCLFFAPFPSPPSLPNSLPSPFHLLGRYLYLPMPRVILICMSYPYIAFCRGQLLLILSNITACIASLFYRKAASKARDRYICPGMTLYDHTRRRFHQVSPTLCTVNIQQTPTTEAGRVASKVLGRGEARSKYDSKLHSPPRVTFGTNLIASLLCLGRVCGCVVGAGGGH